MMRMKKKMKVCFTLETFEKNIVDPKSSKKINPKSPTKKIQKIEKISTQNGGVLFGPRSPRKPRPIKKSYDDDEDWLYIRNS